ncbi:MAG: TAT-variant-translocated molybdopterin oxidoreductase [Gemmataceae bacterium]
MRFWRSLDELADTPEFRAQLAREFPAQANRLLDPVSRRQFLTLMGASLALAGVAGCGRQRSDETIVPQVHPPEQTGGPKPQYFATAMPMPGGAVGVLVESQEGRPIKIEGNPLHPASLGATDAITQASILGLYDPDRSQSLKHLGRVVGWNDAIAKLQEAMKPFVANRGKGLALLTGSINSPTLADQIAEFQRTYPEAKWYVHEPAMPRTSRDAARTAFGEPLDFVYRLNDADVIVALDCDLFSSGPDQLRHAREFARRRKLNDPADATKMNRLNVVEPMPTPTGAVADHRLPLRASQVEAFARALAQRLGVLEGESPADPAIAKFLDAVANDLRGKSGRSLVVAGVYQPAAVHLLAQAINDRLGNLGKTVIGVSPVDSQPDSAAVLEDLSKAINANEVQLLLILSCNPVYSAPAGLNFAETLNKVPVRVRLGLYEDETAALCHWHIPEAHYLESWSDARSADGTATIIQPLIAPLYDGKTPHEVLAAFSNQPTRPGREIIRERWQRWHTDQRAGGSFDVFFRKSLHDGVIANSASALRNLALRTTWRDDFVAGSEARRRPGVSTQLQRGLRSPEATSDPATKYETEFELILRPDPNLHDGRFANNGWLQELPKPLTKIVWDNAAIISPATARALGVNQKPGPHGGEHGELITEIVMVAVGPAQRAQRNIRVPVFVLPGHADGAITLHLGFGRTQAGRVGTDVGVNANLLVENGEPSFISNATIYRTGETYTLGCTQQHWLMEGRDLVRLATAAEFERDPSCKPHEGEHNHGHNPAVEGLPQELYTNPQVTGQQWGMVIDLAACNGCSACVVACQAENNIPVVGKEQVTRGREMHWLRIDRYFTGDESNPQIVHQPLPCMHCENAPCEVVCPVEATSHSPDGLNEMTYNRCVGTRYCANNCPYKVRRFNFFQYTDYATESLRLLRNPDVSVRSRGVMEKCTYCVQRIRSAEITAKNERRGIRDGEVVTACQAACPTEAIIFGNINDAKSRVAKERGLPRNYGLLTELNTKPRTTYLAAVRNP